MILHTASIFTPLPKHTGQQPADQSHVDHGADWIGRDWAASGGAADKVIIRKPGQHTANRKQCRPHPLFPFFFHVIRLLSDIPPHNGRLRRRRPRRSPPAAAPWYAHRPRQTRQGYWYGWTHRPPHSRCRPVPPGS